MTSFKNFMHRYLILLLFLPLPILLLFVSQWELNNRGSYFEDINSDPEYAYLLNGLALLNGHSPGHVDHPGTTVQMLSAVVIKIKHTIRIISDASTPTINLDVLQDPEGYLHTIHDVIAFGIAFLYFAIAVQVFYITKFIWVAIGFQIFPFLSISIIHALARVSPDPFLIITVLLGTLLLVEINKNKLDHYPFWQSILMGLFLGIGIVTKIIFLPFLLLVFWFPRTRDRIIAFSTFIASILLLTIPIWSRYTYFLNWATNLITKQGSHGTGPQGVFPPPQTLMENLKQLVWLEPIFFIMLGFLVVYTIMIGKNRSLDNKLEFCRGLLVLCILVLQLIMSMKFPNPRYMIHTQVFLGYVFLMIIFKIKSTLSKNSYIHKIVRFSLMTILIGFGVMHTFIFFRISQTIKTPSNTKIIDEIIKADYGQCKIIPYYGASDLSYALMFGNQYSDRYFSEPLSEIFPNAIEYDRWKQIIVSISGENKEDEIVNLLNKGNCILLRGGQLLFYEMNFHAQFDLIKIIDTGHEQLFQLININPKTP